MIILMTLMVISMVSYLQLLKENKCFCYKKQMVINLSECDIDCYREKSCRQATNKKIDKEINNAG